MSESKLFFLHKPIPAHSLALFRIGFGIFMLLELLHFSNVGFVENYIGHVSFNFKYDILYAPTPPIIVIRGLFLVAFLSAILIILGKWLKWASLAFFLSFSYIFLLEKSIYNNHLYLFCLLAFLLITSNADQALSLRKEKTGTVFRWNLLAFQLMVIAVYFFGGIAKLNPDWIVLQEPATTLLKSKGITGDFFVLLIIYGGLFFDLTIGALLLIKKTRKMAFLAVVFFNISNAWIFDDINIFPYIMLFSLVLFVEPERIKSFFEARKSIPKEAKVGPKKRKEKKKGKSKKAISKAIPKEAAILQLQQTPSSRIAFKVICLFFIIQLIMPFRHFFIPGNVDWTGDAQRFSWRMKIYTKKIQEFKFAAFDLDKKIIHPIEMKAYLLADQINQMATDPSMVLQFAHYLGEYSKEKLKNENLEIKVKLKLGMNGREPIYLVSDTTDLLGIEKRLFKNHEWVVPLN